MAKLKLGKYRKRKGYEKPAMTLQQYFQGSRAIRNGFQLLFQGDEGADADFSARRGRSRARAWSMELRTVLGWRTEQ